MNEAEAMAEASGLGGPGVSEMEVLAPGEVSALEAQERGQLDSQVATAKAYPRHLKTFVDKLTSWSTVSEESALTCMYSIPRAGKRLVGPSIRFAELVAAAYGNIRCQGAIVSESERSVEAHGTCIDLESNVGIRVSVSRRITTRGGKRYGDDMIQTTSQAAVSLALRNAILRTVPRALWEPSFKASQEVAVGGKGSFGDRRAGAFTFLAEQGCEEARILAHLERERIEEVTIDDLLLMKTVAQEMKAGNLKPEHAFPAPVARPTEESRSATASAAQSALDGGSE